MKIKGLERKVTVAGLYSLQSFVCRKVCGAGVKVELDSPE
jgi:hypothetical protein